MELTNEQLVVFLVLLVAVAAMLVISPTLRVPYPIVLVIGGVAVGFVPGMPELELPPDLVLVAVLPPLLYAGTFFTSLHELKLNMRPIGLLAVGLVIVTMLAVALVAHAAVGLSWSTAFVLGAIVSPTDPVAATAIARRFGVPRRLVAIVEGESLINDGTALVAYRFAVVAVVTGAFSIWKAGLEFVYAVTAGVAIGLAVGWLVRQLRRRLDNPPLEITIALLSAYLAAIPAELIHASAVLAAVTVGVYMGAHTSELTTAQTRVQGDAVWEIIVFMLNALLFVLIGLQLPVIVDELSGGEPAGTLLLYGLAVSATVILVRIGWTFAVTYVPRLLSRRIRERDPLPPWQHPAFVSWAGMRGAVSLAAALALPLTMDDGAAFPDRDLILLLAFSVVAATLVGQGLTMPLVIRFLGLESDRHLEEEEARARVQAAEAALARLEELVDEDWVPPETAERLRGLYSFRHGRFTAQYAEEEEAIHEEQQRAYQRLRRELIEAEREVLDELRRDGAITEHVVQRVVRDLDLEDLRLDP